MINRWTEAITARRRVAALVVLLLVAPGCTGETVESPTATAVEVTGLASCVIVDEGTVSGNPVPPESGIALSELRGYRGDCRDEASDPRVTGAVQTVVDCDFAFDGDRTTGTCGGTITLTNGVGSWAGVVAGTTSWTIEEPEHVHIMDATMAGAGGYEGLQFVVRYQGTLFPWTITGRIEAMG